MTRPHSDRGQGRKPLPESERTVVGSMRLKPAEWAKFKALGGVEWLRAAIKRARLPG